MKKNIIIGIVLIFIVNNTIIFFSNKQKKQVTISYSQSVCDEVLKQTKFDLVEKFKEKPVYVNFSSNPDTKMFYTEITNDIKSGPNFAGHFVISEWGCGTDCSGRAIIDLNNGKIVDYMPVNEDGNMWSYNVNSRLLVFNPKENYEEYKGKTLEELKDMDLKRYRTYYELVEKDGGDIWLYKLCTENVFDGIYRINTEL